MLKLKQDKIEFVLHHLQLLLKDMHLHFSKNKIQNSIPFYFIFFFIDNYE